MRAPVSTTAMQVASRLLLVWAVVDQFPSLARSAGYASMLLAWSVTEVVRYSYFVFALSGSSPGLVSWLRYNTFYVLYPLGISSECWLIWSAVQPAQAQRQEFAWALQTILFVYIPGRSLAGGLSTWRSLTSCRIVCSVHAHDGAAKEGHEGQAGAKDGIRIP